MIKRFIRENFVLVLGISLPLLLLCTFLIVQGISRVAVDPPHYKLLLTSDRYYSMNDMDVYIDDNGHLKIFVNPHKNKKKKITFALYDPENDTIKTYNLEVPVAGPSDTGNEQDKKINVAPPPELAGKTYSDNITAPDGYRYDKTDGRGYGLVHGIFGGHHGRSLRVVKGSASYKIPDLPWKHYRTNFIGWMIDDRKE